MIDALLLLFLAAATLAGARALIRPRRPAGIVALVVGALLTATIATWQLSKVRAGVLGPTLLRVDTDRPMVALTLDDGPYPAYTDDVLDLLDAAGARATFFLEGRALSEHPELGLRIRGRGHELGNHSWSHDRMVFRSLAWMRHEVDATDEAIMAAGQAEPIPFRPPYGKRLLGLHRVLGDRPAVLWDLEPESDPTLADDPEALARYVVEHARPGSILLLHALGSSRTATREALPMLLSGLRDRGFEVVTLRTLRDG